MSAAKPRVILAPAFRAVNDIFRPDALARLHDVAEVVWGRDEPMPQAEFEAALTDATAVAFGWWTYGFDAIAKAGQNLKFVYEVAGTLDHPDLDYATCFERGIAVGSCAPAFAPAVAEMALALGLASGRMLTAGDAEFRAGTERWLEAGNDGVVTHWGKTFGFIGAGSISRHLQSLLAPFDGRFVAYDPWLDPKALTERNIEPVGLEQLVTSSDIIYVLALPTPENKWMVSRELMELLLPHQLLVVVSRAHLVDFDAMTEMVLAGRFRAATDVFPAEPFPSDHPIRRAPGAVLSAHKAGPIPEAMYDIGQMVVDDLTIRLTGEGALRMQYATPEFVRGLGAVANPTADGGAVSAS
jgi:phosphoglycerate dehydrogenase-like enzyme